MSLQKTKTDRRVFPPAVKERVKADWLRNRSAEQCGRLHDIAYRTVQLWVKKYDWESDANRLDKKAKAELDKNALKERMSALSRIRTVNDKIYERLEAAPPDATYSDFREGIKLEQLFEDGPMIGEEGGGGLTLNLFQFNMSLSPEELKKRSETLVRRALRIDQRNNG